MPYPRLTPPLMRRWAQLVLGFLLWGAAIALMIRSGLGLGPWDAFHLGLHRLTGVSVGVASIATGLAIVVASLPAGIRPRAGTVANMVLIGLFVDVMLPLVPAAGGLALGFVYYAAALPLIGLGTGIYIAARLGSGPRDGLMLALAARTGWPVRRVRTLIELSALGAGWAMGGTIGVGTVLYALLAGPAVQWGLKRYGVLPATAARRGVSGEPPARTPGSRRSALGSAVSSRAPRAERPSVVRRPSGG